MDETIDRLARLVHAYTAPPGALKFDNVFVNDQAQVVVTDIAPLPAAIPRLIADALTQLRAALEHTLFAEVEHRLGRHLSPQEARLIEMPACASTEDYRAWLAHRRRSLIPPLQNGAPLTHRIRDLQPFQRRDHADHPMRLLAEHTNVAKHRTPAVAAARLGPVYPDKPHPGLTTAIPFNPKSQPGDGLPLSVGDVIATGPGSVRTELSVVVTVSIRRPHTNVWNLVMKELEYLEDWVRTTAIPLLITGTRDVAPLPPHMDIAVGHRDLRCALQLAGPTSATQRARSRIVSAVARADLIDLVSNYDRAIPSEAIRNWATALDDAAITHRLMRLIGLVEQPAALVEELSTLITEVRLFEQQRGSAAGRGSIEDA
ncbi:hypothetical protein OG497_39305 [Streptomyces sp. NBC_01242]|uniref:hypothetical protein n=1 Tax=Streptomyces sp. NBC_01242 TaxID=2903795 RepID=UPI00224CECB4|nr:hypothetical protein [Streptomyces sp. NBC_01242]MCX4799891.1 hypothetical protein [Streptomyces sp. NBC_01242]